MKALIIGATGATGKDLVNSILQNDAYSEIVLFVRHLSGLHHPKLTEIVTDFNNLETISELIKGDVIFSCLGTTLKIAGTKENQTHIDYEIPLKFAQIAKRNGVEKLVLLSAYGASPDSKVFYSKLKGMLEENIAAENFGTFIIFRPGLLLRKNTDRIEEKISSTLLNFLNYFGFLKKFQPMPTAILAYKMIKSTTIYTNGKHIIELDKIFKI